MRVIKDTSVSQPNDWSILLIVSIETPATLTAHISPLEVVVSVKELIQREPVVTIRVSKLTSSFPFVAAAAAPVMAF